MKILKINFSTALSGKTTTVMPEQIVIKSSNFFYLDMTRCFFRFPAAAFNLTKSRIQISLCLWPSEVWVGD